MLPLFNRVLFELTRGMRGFPFTRPHFDLRIESVRYCCLNDDGPTLVVVSAHLSNTGTPSRIDHWLAYYVHGGETETLPVICANIPWVDPSSVLQFFIDFEDQLVIKAYRPVKTGSLISGKILFMLDGNRTSQMSRLDFEIGVGFKYPDGRRGKTMVNGRDVPTEPSFLARGLPK